MWLGLCELRVMNDRRWPWLLLVPQRPGAEEIHDLTPLDQAMLTFETNMVAQALKTRHRLHQDQHRRRSATSCGSFMSMSSPARKAIPAGRARSGATACASPTSARTSAGLPKRSRRRYKPRHLAASCLESSMSFRLFDAPPAEPSQFVGFAGNIDRPPVGEPQRRFRRQGARRSGGAAAADGRRAALPEARRRRRASTAISRRPKRRARRRARERRPARLFRPAARCLPPRPASNPKRCPKRSRRSTTARSICRACSIRPALGALAQAASAARLACQPSLLRQMRAADRDAGRRLQAALHRLRHRAFSAHRPGRDHADGDAGQMPARARPAFRARHVFGARRLHRARRDDRERGAPRDLRGSRASGSAASSITPASPGRFPIR